MDVLEKGYCRAKARVGEHRPVLFTQPESAVVSFDQKRVITLPEFLQRHPEMTLITRSSRSSASVSENGMSAQRSRKRVSVSGTERR